MLDALLDLSRASESALEFLVQPTASANAITALASKLRTKDCRERRNYDRLLSTLSAQRDSYDSDAYINVHKVLKIVLGRNIDLDDDDGPWRPDGILQKANLATLATGIFGQFQQQNEAPFVEDLDKEFPKPFLNGFAAVDMPSTGRSTLEADTIDIGLQVRTQYTIMLLARHAGQVNYDSDDILGQVFFESDTVLRGWPIAGLLSGDMTQDIEDVVVSRVDEIRIILSQHTEDPAKGIQMLQIEYSWNAFVHEMITWIGQRLAEIDDQISANGGAKDIHRYLRNEVEPSTSAKVSFEGEDDNGEIDLLHEVPSETLRTSTGQRKGPVNAANNNTYKFGVFKYVRLQHVRS